MNLSTEIQPMILKTRTSISSPTEIQPMILKTRTSISSQYQKTPSRRLSLIDRRASTRACLSAPSCVQLKKRTPVKASSEFEPTEYTRNEKRNWWLAVLECRYKDMLTLLGSNSKLASWKASTHSNGFSLSNTDLYLNTALHYAARRGNVDCIRLLVKRFNVDVNVKNHATNTRTAQDLTNRCIEVNKFKLLDDSSCHSVSYADIHVRDYSGNLPCNLLSLELKPQFQEMLTSQKLKRMLDATSLLLPSPGQQESRSFVRSLRGLLTGGSSTDHSNNLSTGSASNTLPMAPPYSRPALPSSLGATLRRLPTRLANRNGGTLPGRKMSAVTLSHSPPPPPHVSSATMHHRIARGFSDGGIQPSTGLYRRDSTASTLSVSSLPSSSTASSVSSLSSRNSQKCKKSSLHRAWSLLANSSDSWLIDRHASSNSLMVDLDKTVEPHDSTARPLPQKPNPEALNALLALIPNNRNQINNSNSQETAIKRRPSQLSVTSDQLRSRLAGVWSGTLKRGMAKSTAAFKGLLTSSKDGSGHG